MRQQLGRDVFFQLIEWLEDFLESGAGVGGNARKGAKFRKLCGKDANGSWFKASLMVTVPERVEGLPNGMDPVVLSLVRKKLMRRTPPNQTQAAPGCDTILEEIDPDDETASDATSTTQSSAMTSSFSSDFWKDGTAADPEGALPGAVDWTSHTSIQEFEFLRIIPVDGMPGGSTGAPGTQEPPRPRRKILISL